MIAEYPFQIILWSIAELNCKILRADPIQVEEFLPETDVYYVYVTPEATGQPDVKMGHEVDITPAFDLTIFRAPPLSPEVVLRDIGRSVGEILSEFEILLS